MDLQPYCGSAPVPAEILGRWNLDRWLLAVLALLAAVHLLVLCGSRQLPRKAWFWAATWIALAMLFVSPFCALSSALFTARVAQHIILISIAAPLFILSFPSTWRAASLPAGSASTILLTHVFFVWFWHAPAPYTISLVNGLIFWTAELTLFGSAIVLWHMLLSAHARPAIVVGSYLMLIAQMGLLGAIITFARKPIYSPHVATTEPWGLSALSDQQLGGLIMWVPATIPYLLAALVYIGVQLSLAEKALTRRPTI